MTVEKDSLSKKISFLRPGWWLIHVLGIWAVYMLGNLIWR